MERYKYYIVGNKIICISHYAGKSVKGIAKCAPDDEWNEELGKHLARLRCDCKIAALRQKNAFTKFSEACKEFSKAELKVHKYQLYLDDADVAYEEAEDNLMEFYGDHNMR